METTPFVGHNELCVRRIKKNILSPNNQSWMVYKRVDAGLCVWNSKKKSLTQY